jgi:molecular chaperone IbpA
MYIEEPREPHDPWDKHKRNPYSPWGPDIHRDSLKKWQEEKKPKPVTIEDLFPKLDRWAIGFDPLFATLQSLSTAKTVSYPPYNLTKKKDKFILEVALAGYRKDDLEIFVEDRTLVIQTLPVDDLEEDDDIEDVESLHHGIAQRSFTQKFALSEYIVVKSAIMKDGILLVVLENELPEEKKPKKIDIK